MVWVIYVRLAKANETDRFSTSQLYWVFFPVIYIKAFLGKDFQICVNVVINTTFVINTLLLLTG